MNPFTDINIRFSVEQSKGYALLMAFLPIVMMYRTPGLAVGLSTSSTYVLSYRSRFISYIRFSWETPRRSCFP